MTRCVVALPVRPPSVWTSWISEWRTWRRAAGHRDATIELGTYWARRAARDLDLPPELVTEADLLRFLADGGWGPETKRCARAQLRSFFGWAVRSGHLNVDPSADLPPVRVPRAAARPVAESAVARVCSLPDDRVRLAAILAGRMGLRRAEISAARAEDITNGRLLVHGKGGHTRHVLVHPEARPLLPASGPLIPSLHTGGHLTPAHVGKLLSRALGDAGTAHMLRHRYATVAYRSTRNMPAVQAVLGHASIVTTQRYVATDDDEQAAAVLAA